MFVQDDPAAGPAKLPPEVPSPPLSFTLFDISPVLATVSRRGVRQNTPACLSPRVLFPFFLHRLQTPTTYLPWNHIVPKTGGGGSPDFPIWKSPRRQWQKQNPSPRRPPPFKAQGKSEGGRCKGRNARRVGAPDESWTRGTAKSACAAGIFRLAEPGCAWGTTGRRDN